jgi:acetyl esterase/lipase
MLKYALILAGVLLVPLAVLAACAPARLLNATIPERGLSIRRDLPYGTDPRQRLDLYAPAAAKRPLPVILFLYGGGWDDGGKADYLFAAEGLARGGFLVAVADYRIYPAVTFPAFVEDAALAIAWVKREIAALGGDPDRLVLMGHSAGAYNAALVALDPRYLAAHGLAPADLAAVVGLAGPYAFNPLEYDSTRAIFDVGRPVDEMRPVAFAGAGAPPMLLLHGLDDTTVQPRNTEQLAGALDAAGAEVEAKLYPGVAHIGIVLALARGFRGKAPVLADVLEFARRVTAP